MMRLIAFAIVIFAVFSAYNEFFSKHKNDDTGPYIDPQYEEAIYKARSDLAAIRSGISRDAKRNQYSGKTPYPTQLTKESDHLFGNVLITPISPSTQGWQWKGEHSYTYTYAPGKSAKFEYSPRDGELYCTESYEVCQLF